MRNCAPLHFFLDAVALPTLLVRRSPPRTSRCYAATTHAIPTPCRRRRREPRCGPPRRASRAPCSSARRRARATSAACRRVATTAVAAAALATASTVLAALALVANAVAATPPQTATALESTALASALAALAGAPRRLRDLLHARHDARARRG